MLTNLLKRHLMALTTRISLLLKVHSGTIEKREGQTVNEGLRITVAAIWLSNCFLGGGIF